MSFEYVSDTSVQSYDAEQRKVFIRDHNPNNEAAYFNQKVIDIRAGGPVWCVANFESNGVVYNYFNKGEFAGLVDVDPDGGPVVAFAGLEGEGGFVVYQGSFFDAIAALEEYTQWQQANFGTQA